MNLVLNDVPASVVEELEARAEKSGRSVEAEATAILKTAVAETNRDLDSLQLLVRNLYGDNFPVNGVNNSIAYRR